MPVSVPKTNRATTKTETEMEGEEHLHAGQDHPHLLQELLVALAKVLLL